MDRKAAVGFIIRPNKEIEASSFADLEDYQKVVGGLIEAIHLTWGTMYCNEEFLFRFGPTEFNSIATDVAGLGGRQDLMFTTGILGPVVCVGPPDQEGYETSIGPDFLGAISRVAREAGGKLVEA